jgi:NAD(P)-dependent dehydrogenase (short-subunit alcohol dehydrogenase family)
MAPRVFFITGCSSGLGHEYVKVVLQHGDYVVATARNPSKLSFEDANSTNSIFLDLDVTIQSSINSAFQAALERFGRIDVVVNNAGVGLAGEFESLSDRQIRYIMEVNFFGLLNVTRKAMETMRDLKTGGVIQQISSIGGHQGM